MCSEITKKDNYYNRLNFRIIMRNIGLVIIGIILIALAKYSFIKPSQDSWAAAETLIKSEQFGLSPQGAGAIISEEHKSFFVILRSPKSHLVFRHVYDEGGECAKAYAVVGLKLTFMGKHDKRITEFANSEYKIKTSLGKENNFITSGQIVQIYSDKSFQAYFEQNE